MTRTAIISSLEVLALTLKQGIHSLACKEAAEILKSLDSEIDASELEAEVEKLRHENERLQEMLDLMVEQREEDDDSKDDENE